MEEKELVIEYTKDDIAQMRAEGIDEDAIPSVGKHRFRRVSRNKVYPRKESKMRINIYLDCDIVDHFRSRADKPNAAPYQTQINAELRKIMERDLVKDKETIDATVKELLENDDFLEALTEKLGLKK